MLLSVLKTNVNSLVVTVCVGIKIVKKMWIKDWNIWWMKYQQMHSVVIYYYINTLLHVLAP
jgi:hypothetical protein